jgi:hypothetical protein
MANNISSISETPPISVSETQAGDDIAGNETVIVHPPSKPWYQRGLHRITGNKNIMAYVGIILFLVVGFVLTQATQRGSQQVQIKASSHKANVSIYPVSQVLTPNGGVQVWATVDSQVAFIRVEIIFDPSVVKLNNEVSLTSPLTRVVAKTTMAQANSTGTIVIAVALDPSGKNSPPTGTLKLADITFAGQTKNPNISSTLNIPSGSVQIVHPDGSLYSITTAAATLTLNPVATPTPTPKPTTTPTETPTAAPPSSPVPAVPTQGSNLIQNPSFESTGSNWYSPWWFETDGGAAADLSQDKTTAGDGAASAKIHVTKSSTTNWHVQFMNGLGITKGRTYTVSFWAKADTTRSIGLEVSHKTSPYTNYFKGTAALTTSWQKFTYTFTPNASDDSTLHALLLRQQHRQRLAGRRIRQLDFATLSNY